MKTNNRSQSSKKPLILIVSIAAVLVIGSFIAVRAYQSNTDQSTDQTPSITDEASEEQRSQGNEIKDNSVNDEKLSGSDQPSDPVVDPNGKELVEVNITSVQKIDDAVRVNVLISNLDQSGSCDLKVTSLTGDILFTATSGVQALANTSTCKGFDIPSSSLSKGYSITVIFSSGDKYGSTSYKS